jgi:hypothetical protein
VQLAFALEHPFLPEHTFSQGFAPFARFFPTQYVVAVIRADLKVQLTFAL